MSTIMPESEKVKNAIRWISSVLEEDESRNIRILIDQATFQYDLSPKETEKLYQFYKV